MDDFLSKPVTNQKLQEKLLQWMPSPIGPIKEEPFPVAAHESAIVGISNISEKIIAELEVKLGTKEAGPLLLEFLEAFQSTHEQLKVEIGAKDAAAVRKLTHRLIGLCPVFNAQELADLALAIESSIKSSDWQSAQTSCDELDKKFGEFAVRLQKQ
jgi:HPt (histidine-containing phosphotransfer) domain-containing protein